MIRTALTAPKNMVYVSFLRNMVSSMAVMSPPSKMLKLGLRYCSTAALTVTMMQKISTLNDLSLNIGACLKECLVNIP